jgi:hypothetical protein
MFVNQIPSGHTRDNSMDALNKKDRFSNRMIPSIPTMETQNIYPNVILAEAGKNQF